tara:strand:- start:1501 stop:2022 length:522 start_codon:yes stop_codon:yes gene_type:complete
MKKGYTKYHIVDKKLLTEVLFHDYLMIKKMRAPEGNKIKMLSTLFSINPNSWRVTGITLAALEIFKKHNFKKVPRMGINRSHLIQRHTFYKHLLNIEISDEHMFWEKYYKNDRTVLATSSENMKNSTSITDESLDVPDDNRNLFKTSGYSWKHKDEEEDFLRDLYFKKNNSLK